MTDRHLATARSPAAQPRMRRSARPRIRVAHVPHGHARVRVLKAGHGRIFTGQLVDGVAQTLEWGDEFAAPEAIAKAHEDRGFGEIAE